MDITIQENLKQFRKDRGNTQEELAEHLGISIQAVSKWERGEGFPDISLLPKIAFYYGISVDDLLGVAKMQIDKKVNEYHQKSDILQRNAAFDENLALWSQAIKKFPNNYDVMYGYVIALSLKNQSCANPDEYADETIKIAERLYKESNKEKHKYHMIWTLTRLYNRLGNQEKAIEYIKKAPDLDVTQDNMLSFILKGEQAVEHIQEVLCCFMDVIDGQVATMIKEGNFNNDERRKACLYRLNLFTSLYEDGDYGFYCTRVSNIYADLALCDAEEKNSEGVMQNLAFAAEYSVKFLTQRGFTRTSLLVNRTVHPDGHTGYPTSADNDCKELLNRLKQEKFDFCRQDDRFVNIEKQLAKYSN